MLNGKLTATCALLLAAVALFGCGDENQSTDSKVPSPPSDKLSQKPKAASKFNPSAQAPKSKVPSRSSSEIKERERETTPAAEKPKNEVEKTQTRSKPPADETRQLPSCAEDPTSRKCKEERNPPPPDTSPAEPQMHGDKPAARPTGCKKPGGCGDGADR